MAASLDLVFESLNCFFCSQVYFPGRKLNEKENKTDLIEQVLLVSHNSFFLLFSFTDDATCCGHGGAEAVALGLPLCVTTPHTHSSNTPLYEWLMISIHISIYHFMHSNCKSEAYFHNEGHHLGLHHRWTLLLNVFILP